MSNVTDQSNSDYYAVIFTSQRTENSSGYDEMSRKMMDLAKQQPGFLDFESVRDSNGFGITLSYWTDRKSIEAWKLNTDHIAVQEAGKEKWYDYYTVRIAKIKKHYKFKNHKN